jgi:hypothetical protein
MGFFSGLSVNFVKISAYTSPMGLSSKTFATIGIVVEALAAAACLYEFLRLTFFAPTATMLLHSAQPYLLGAVAALAYLAASSVLSRKGKYLLSNLLAIMMVAVLVVLKLAFL